MKSNKFQAPTTVFLVGKDDQVLVPSDNIVTSGSSLNLADGQLGVLSTDHSGTVSFGKFIPAGTTSAQVASVKVVQGTPNSSQTYKVNPFKNNDPAYVESHKILADRILSVSTQKYEPGMYNMYRIKTVTGVDTTDATYKMTLGFEGARKDITYGYNRDVISATVTTPTVAATNTNDYVLQNLALDLNRFSQVTANASPANFSGNKQFIVLGLNIGGGSGTVIGTMNAGDTFNYAQYTVNGSTVTATYTADVQFINSLHNAIAEDATLSTARILNLGSVTPGSAATINALLVVAFDEDEALAFDDVKYLKIRLSGCGISGTGVTYTGGEVSAPFEGANTERQVYLNYKDRAALQIMTAQNHVVGGEYFITPPNYLDRTVDGYTVTRIVHYGETENLNNTSRFPMETVILLAASIEDKTEDADTGFTVSTDDSTTVTSLNATLGAWLSDADDRYNNIEYKGEATKSTPFV